ncbi:hypothetical protein [Hymenobacter cavernae]|uniref:Uncharacterized protein n=1 Tax=Hymenobacter cavernae TaxID=2044852 RepID=A0ABQ1THH0_9BACT|nr:hypothetical protein [Hymenobacter cavernae]GGE95217.1 hypothetical protein GCM10011383_02370 [Hymenobacter cavernae]
MLTIKDFFALDDLVNNKWGRKAYQHVDYCGLEPIMPPENYSYFCTPVNTISFARTGGNGVHFGILNGVGEEACGPVIMTVPMASVNNIVVAETLEEFLGIGCRNGWFVLEQLAYNASEALAYYASQDEDLSEEEQSFLSLVRSELQVEYVPLLAERLAYLKHQFLPQLQVKPIE